MGTCLLIAQQPQGGGGPFGSETFMLYMLGMFALLYFIVLRPMSRRQRDDEQKMRDSIKRGSKVVTSAGIYGTVVSVKENEDEIVIRSEDTRLRVRKTSVLQVLGEEAEAGK